MIRPAFWITSCTGLSSFCRSTSFAWRRAELRSVFSMIRRHEVNEGFLVTGLLFPSDACLPDIPLWQVAIGIMFGVVIGKEIFGGTGRNFLNPALTARAFLYFAYAGQISGDKVWTAAKFVNGRASTAIPVRPPWASSGQLKPARMSIGMRSAMEPLQCTSPSSRRHAARSLGCSRFLGMIPGSMGETSVLACLIGAAILIATGIGSWRIMAGVCIGALGLSSLLYMSVARQPIRCSKFRLVALRDRWLCVWDGLHGDRSGQCVDDRNRQVVLRRA